MLASFWCAHARARSYGVDKQHLHPKHILTLWKQLILSTTDTYLPFIQKDIHITRLGAAINTSLSSIFTPYVYPGNNLYPALKTELGIPSTRTLIDIATLALHAHIAQLPSDATAKILYKIYQIEYLKFSSHVSFPERARQILFDVGLARDWENLSLDIPENARLLNLTQKTQKNRWLNKTYTYLFQQEREKLQKWANNTPGRAQAYIQLTELDHEYQKHTTNPSTSPFKQRYFLTQIEDPKTAYNILLLRSQISQLPAHIPIIRTKDNHIRTLGTRTTYPQRHCTLCLPPPNTWGLLGPDPNHPVGNETHILLTCFGPASCFNSRFTIEKDLEKWFQACRLQFFFNKRPEVSRRRGFQNCFSCPRCHRVM